MLERDPDRLTISTSNENKTQWKMVCFRLSASEYETMSELCQTHGFDNMSRFALQALRAFTRSRLPDGTLSTQAEEVWKCALELLDKSKRLCKSIDGY